MRWVHREIDHHPPAEPQGQPGDETRRQRSRQETERSLARFLLKGLGIVSCQPQSSPHRSATDKPRPEDQRAQAEGAALFSLETPIEISEQRETTRPGAAHRNRQGVGQRFQQRQGASNSSCIRLHHSLQIIAKRRGAAEHSGFNQAAFL